jgi:hypothetical protein
MRLNPDSPWTTLRQRSGKTDAYTVAEGTYDAGPGQFRPGAEQRADVMDDSQLDELTPHKPGGGYGGGPKEVKWPRGGPDPEPRRSMRALSARAR